MMAENVKTDGRTEPDKACFSEPPFVAALCPTYRRPKCLANALACWFSQDYPSERRQLIILDDGGNFETQGGPGWLLVASAPRYPSLPEKYNALATLATATPSILLPWEDDDVYLPDHISRHVATLRDSGWCQPSRVFSTCGGTLHEEAGAGRFHGGWSFRRELFERVGRYPKTQELSFDQQLGGRLGIVKPGDPTAADRPSYVFRWGNPYYHGQAFGDTFYETCGRAGDPTFIGTLQPQMDEQTEAIYRELGA